MDQMVYNTFIVITPKDFERLKKSVFVDGENAAGCQIGFCG